MIYVRHFEPESGETSKYYLLILYLAMPCSRCHYSDSKSLRKVEGLGKSGHKLEIQQIIESQYLHKLPDYILISNILSANLLIFAMF
jgi:hypothetical protein